MPVQERKVILDKSFLQAESRDGRRLHALKEAGCMFIVNDMLVYELCTDGRTNQWPATQRKLFPFADRIEVWKHTSELLKSEIADQRPTAFPIDEESTDRFRSWFNGGEVYVPSDLESIGALAFKQREEDSVDALIAECRYMCGIDPTYTARIQRGGEEAKAILSDLMARKDFTEFLIKRDHGNPADQGLYIKGAEQGLGPEWFAYHNARSTLALYCVFMSKFGLVNTPGKDFRHTKLDSDYAALLHYADALATNETSGSLADVCEWLYGGSKKIFSTGSFDAALPTYEELRVAAYHKWERDGGTHGHDQEDWFSAKKELDARLWERLSRTRTKADAL
jgi:hypothetical protein